MEEINYRVVPGATSKEIVVAFEPLSRGLDAAAKAMERFTTTVSMSTKTKGVPIRGRAVAGRNSPCPCGSGEKYKRCCSMKPLMVVN